MTTGNKQNGKGNVLSVNETPMHRDLPVPVTPLLPDDPEMMPYVLCYLEKGVRTYTDAVQESLNLLTRDVATPENLHLIEHLLKQAKEHALVMFADHVRKLEE